MSYSGRQAAALSVAAALLLAAAIADLAQQAWRVLGRPRLATQMLSPQRDACVIRGDACRLVEALRSIGAPSFEVSDQLNPEVHQRVIELAFPDRARRGAPVSVELCHRVQGARRAPVRIADIEYPDDRDADFCVVDRR